MQGENFIKSQLALTAWRDAKDDGLDGMLAVCFTIRDRVRSGWFNADWISLLSHHRDYSWTEAPYPDELPSTRNYAFDLLLKEIDGIFAGTRENTITMPQEPLPIAFQSQTVKPVPLYYARLNDPNLREWFILNISRQVDKHRLIASVGSLSFFS